MTTLTHLHSITSTVQSLNIRRNDPRVTHELLTMKLHASKPQQSVTFEGIISHPSKKSFFHIKNALGLQINEREIILDSSQRPKRFYKKEDAYVRQFSAKWTECYEASSSWSRSEEKIRLEIQFHKTKWFNLVRQSPLMAANEGIRKHTIR